MDFNYTRMTDLAYRQMVDAVFIRGTKSLAPLLCTNLFTAYIAGRRLSDALQGFINVCATLELITLHGRGGDHNIQSLSFFLRRLVILFAQTFKLDEKDIALVEAWRDACKMKSEAHAWFYPKLELLVITARSINQAREYARSFNVDPLYASQHAQLVDSIALSTHTYVDQMMTALPQLRRFGVKTSFFQDGMLHRPEDACVIMDPLGTFDRFGFLSEVAEHPLAWVAVAERKRLTSIEIKTVHEETGAGKLDKLRFQFPTKMIMTFDQHGEFDISNGAMLMPLRPFFQETGSEAVYEILRLAHAVRLYDLVVPVDVVATMPQPNFPKNMLGAVIGAVKRSFAEKNPDIIVPRLRSLEHLSDIERALALEQERAEETTSARSHRTVGRHEVTGHVRELPPGKKATPEAVALALQSGIEHLAPNETFVKKHERGSGKKQTLPHRAVVKSV